MGQASLAEVRKLVAFSPDASQAYAGNSLYAIVVASFDPANDHSSIGVVGARFNPLTREPEVTENAFWDFYPDSIGQALNFGLFDYVPEHVMREGRKFISAYLRLAPDRRMVRDITGLEAIEALDSLIRGAAKTTEIVAAPEGIGGPTDILLLGSDPKPKRIRWKTD
jgi:hypothetical protein